MKLGAELIGTMGALVLGLLIASARDSYDAQSTELTEVSAKIILLDCILVHYALETKKVHELLRGAVDRLSPEIGSAPARCSRWHRSRRLSGQNPGTFTGERRVRSLQA